MYCSSYIIFNTQCYNLFGRVFCAKDHFTILQLLVLVRIRKTETLNLLGNHVHSVLLAIHVNGYFWLKCVSLIRWLHHSMLRIVSYGLQLLRSTLLMFWLRKKPKGTCLLGNSKKGFGRLSEMSSINKSEKPIAKTNFARNIKG